MHVNKIDRLTWIAHGMGGKGWPVKVNGSGKPGLRYGMGSHGVSAAVRDCGFK